MPDGVDLDPDHTETPPADRQRHEPENGSRSGNIVVDEAAGAGNSGSCGDPRPPAPDAEADGAAAAEKRAGGTRARNEMPHIARDLRGLLAVHGAPQAAQEYAVEPAAEPPGGDAAGMQARPEPPPDEASGPMDAAMGAAAELAAALRAFKADFVRWAENERRGRRRRAGFAMAAGFPACILFGLLVQMQFEVIPLHDPTRGWGEHIWNTYGRIIVDCELEAMRTNGEIACPLTVRP